MMVVAAIVKPITYFFFGILSPSLALCSIRELVLILTAVTTGIYGVSVIMIGLFAFKVFLAAFPDLS